MCFRTQGFDLEIFFFLPCLNVYRNCRECNSVECREKTLRGLETCRRVWALSSGHVMGWPGIGISLILFDAIVNFDALELFSMHEMRRFCNVCHIAGEVGAILPCCGPCV